MPPAAPPGPEPSPLRIALHDLAPADASDAVRILLLAGRPGIGRTALVRRVAERLRTEELLEPGSRLVGVTRENREGLGSGVVE